MTTHPGSREAGFTLLEIVIAVAIFAVLAVILYSSFTGTFRVIEATEGQVALSQRARVALERLGEDLESAYGIPLPAVDGPGERQADFLGEDETIDGRDADRLRFLTRSHLDLGGMHDDVGLSTIGYRLQAAEEGRFVLLRSQSSPFFEEDEERTELVVCRDVATLDFSYFDSEGDEQAGWDPTDGEPGAWPLPRRVAIRLGLYNPAAPEEPPRIFRTSVLLVVERAHGSFPAP